MKFLGLLLLMTILITTLSKATRNPSERQPKWQKEQATQLSGPCAHVLKKLANSNDFPAELPEKNLKTKTSPSTRIQHHPKR